MAQAVILRKPNNSYIVVKANQLQNIIHGKDGTVEEFTYNQIKYFSTVEYYKRYFLSYCAKDSYIKILEKVKNEKGKEYNGVDEKLWEPISFKNYGDLQLAEPGDEIIGILREPNGTSYNYFVWEYTNDYMHDINRVPSFKNLKLYNSESESFWSENFHEGTFSGNFYSAYKDYEFYEKGKNTQLIGEIASLLDSMDKELSEAWGDFLKTSGYDKFKISHTDGPYSEIDFIRYKEALQIWLGKFQKDRELLKKLDNTEKLFIIVNLMVGHHMMKGLTVQEKLDILEGMVKGVLSEFYWSFWKLFIGDIEEAKMQKRETLALEVIRSVTPNQAKEFLEGLVNRNYFTHKDTKITLYKALFFRLDDYNILPGDHNFTAFIKELERLVLAQHGISPVENIVFTPEELKIKTKANFIWNRKMGKNNPEYSISYPNNKTLQIKESIFTNIITYENYDYDENFVQIPSEPTIKYSGIQTKEFNLNHFDLVSFHYLSNPSFIENCQYLDCSNNHFLTFAGYLDYILEKKNTDDIITTLRVSLQAISFTIGVGELIIAIRSANYLRGLIALYSVAGEAYSLIITSEIFNDYLKEAYPEDWVEIKQTLELASIIHSGSSITASSLYQYVQFNKACKFIGEVDALQWNPSAMERLSSSQINTLKEARKKLNAELWILRQNEKTKKIINDEIEFWRNYRNLTIPNAVRGTTEEWETARKIISDARKQLNIPSKHNFGYVSGNISGNPQFFDEFIDPETGIKVWKSVSEQISEIEENKGLNFFKALSIGWSRNTDSEFRMLNAVAKKLKPMGNSNEVYKDVTGTLSIVSELPYCTSCQTIIFLFNKTFPNVKIILIDGTKL